MKHLPVHHEQGTRDRPHFLRMTADAQKTDAAIKSLGFEIWRGRPEIDVYLTVQDPRRTFIVGAETAKPDTLPPLPIPIASERYDGYEQREVVKSIAPRCGFPRSFSGTLDIGAEAVTFWLRSHLAVSLRQ